MLAAACNGDEKCICINDAINQMDSAWGTKGVARKTNGPCNMRVPKTWSPSVPFTAYHSPGNGHFSKFQTLEDGVTACVELYQRNYADLDAYTLTKRWAQTDNPAYHNAVAKCYR